MKRTLIILLAGLMLLAAATCCAAESAYPCFSETPYAYTVTEYPVTNGELSIYGVLYLPEGDGPFPTVIMSHGFNGSESSWTFTANSLASSGFACYAFDFCGGNMLGRSSGKTTQLSVLTEERDLLTVIDHIKSMDFCDAGNLFLMGESMGGVTTALVAAQRADEIRGIVLHYPGFSMIPSAQETYASADDIPTRLRFSGVAIGTQFYGDLLDIDLDALLGAYDGPVHILHGDADEMVPLASSQYAVSIYPNAELTVMPGQGHSFDAGSKAVAAEIAYNLFSGLLQ